MIITTDVLKYEQQMNKLNEEVFPEKQRLNLRNYINDEGKNSSVVAIVVNETFAGFAIVLFTKEIAHLIYLAIEPSMQGDGLGSQVLHQLIEYFKQPLIADVENDEVICDNHGERVSRINFYIRNGFNRTSVKTYTRESS